jgi:U3 small nucleolar RNA-associated protein 3
MGKKRKASSRGAGEPKEYNENTKKRITTYEDVADSEDEFYLNQDKILLDEGPQAKKLRKWKEEGMFHVSFDMEAVLLLFMQTSSWSRPTKKS